MLAGALAVLGLVMAGNANFARTYVKDQLSQQHITFKTVETLSADEKASPCLVAYAGQLLTTGKQAECYANHFIGLHVKTVAGGQTYADVGGTKRALEAQVAAAKAANDPALADLQKQLAVVSAQRTALFEGETSRGLLLTSFGFSDLGEKAAQAATAAYTGAGMLAVLAVAFLLLGFRTPRKRDASRERDETTANDDNQLVRI